MFMRREGRDLGGVDTEHPESSRDFKINFLAARSSSPRDRCPPWPLPLRDSAPAWAVAIVLIYLLIVGFSVVARSFIIITGAAGALAGIHLILLLTHTL